MIPQDQLSSSPRDPHNDYLHPPTLQLTQIRKLNHQSRVKHDFILNTKRKMTKTFELRALRES